MFGKRLQNEFYDPSFGLDWYNSTVFGQEFSVTWGLVPKFKGQVGHMKFMRGQTCWLESSPEDLRDRREIAFSIARGVISSTDVPDDQLRLMWSLIGVESCSPAIADAVCTAYDAPPIRKFSKDTEVEKAMQEIYSSFDIDIPLKDAYRAALFTNYCLLWVREEEGKLCVEYLTPDYFRIENDEVWLVHGSGGRGKTEFEVWTPEKHYWTDSSGEPTRSEDNPYGRLPFVALKLNSSQDIYGYGISEAAEVNGVSNVTHFLATRIGFFQSFGIGILKNFADKYKAGTSLGPGRLLIGDNVGGEVTQQPGLEFVTPDGKFQELDDFRIKRINQFKMGQGLPAHLIDGTSQPPSGFALSIMNEQIEAKRKKFIPSLVRAERQLAELIAKMTAVIDKRPRLLDAAGFSITYARSGGYADKAELEFDLLRKENGLATSVELCEKYLRIYGLTEVEAAAKITSLKSAPVVATNPETPAI